MNTSTSRVSSVGLAALIFLVAQSALAVNLKWLEYSPIRFFTEEDWSMSTAAADKALAEAADGEAVEWHNEKTNNSGSATPVNTDATGERPCRALAIVHQARGKSARTVFRFCEQPDGQWKAVPGGNSAESGASADQ